DSSRPTEGAYAALLDFEDGAFASLTYSGYGRYDSDELMGWSGELGRAKDPAAYGAARKAIAGIESAAEEARAKNARNYGGGAYRAPAGDAPWHEHFGFIVVSCERGDLRPTPRGVEVFADAGRRSEALDKPGVPRAEVIDELCAAVFDGAPPPHDGAWGRATLEACLAILESARTGREIVLHHQVAMRQSQA
ncbi:MAG TPA: gfo/Idh/MocA family oxidoreductase, partial [Usitatibacter sp.]|nr:gfo/Idh/MocA family oxidoreductase [Usitatibacter sp.]